MPDQVTLLKQPLEMLFQCVAARAGGSDHVAHCYPPAAARLVDDLRGQLWQRRHHQPFALNLLGQSAFLLLKCAHKKHYPRLPVGSLRSDGSLGLTQCQVVALLAVFDHRFK